MRNLFIILVLFSWSSLSAQQDADRNIGTTKVVPVSPNAASLGKFGDLPVSNFTGLPNISIPFFSFGTNDLKTSVSLAYHAAGMKVSEVASWTGTGWTLNAGGAISRSVRGLPDELGFFNPVMKVKFLDEHRDDPAYKIDIRNKLIDAGKGQFDTEPDIFYFNFDNASGKFYFNQETGKFYTITKSNLVINYIPGDGFSIRAENGNTYYFTEKEYTNVRTYCDVGGPDNPDYNISSWYLKRVENKTGTDFIEYEYNNNAYSTFRTPNSATAYIEINKSGTALSQYEAPQDQNCYTEIAITSRKLSKISFKEGYVLFTANTSRCDLIGEKMLDKIELFDYDGVFKKRFIFSYGYFGGPGLPAVCNDQVEAEKVRLKLKSVWEETERPGEVIQNKPYVFDYEHENDVFPGRVSYQQDYWGYYNGAQANGGLMPVLMMGSQVVFNSGNDRMPNSAFTQYGALKRITYPTGGYTDFVFENNRVLGSYGPPPPTNEGVYMAGDQVGVQTYYEKEFIINKNGGGTNIGLSFGLLGCEVDYNDYYDYPGMRCADLRIIGMTPGTVSLDVSPNFEQGIFHSSAVYLPNGTYKMMANFIQSGTNFRNFWFEIIWPADQTGTPSQQNVLAGGLRIKRIVDYDGLSHQNDRIRNFEYTFADGKSSGAFIGPWSNSFENNFTVDFNSHYTDPVTGHTARSLLTVNYLRRSTSGNYSLLTSGGSYVGYKNVTVSEGDNKENGRISYNYTTGQDDILNVFPFPYTLKDWTRGSVEVEEVYNNNNPSQLLRNSLNIYTNSSISDPLTTNSQLGLKIGFDRSETFDDGYDWAWLKGLDYMLDIQVPVTTPYPTITGFATLDQSVVKEYVGTSFLEKTTVTAYNTINLMPQTVEVALSDGDVVITETAYPVDYPESLRPVWMQQLIQKNLVGVPIEKLHILKKPDGSKYIVGGVITVYNEQAMVQDIYALEIAGPLAYSGFVRSSVSSASFSMDAHYRKRVSFLEYDAIGNIVRQRKMDDMELSYIWDYNNSYPIAEITNASRKDFFYTSFEGTEGNSSLNDSKTGKQSRSGGYAKMLSDLLNGEYVLSYWQKAGGQWTFHSESILVNSSNYQINLTGQIDELRFYPAKAHLTTYTFDPLVGMTSQCDAKNMITYFEYDNFGRLTVIKDMNGRILKQVDYQYQVTGN